MLSGTYYKPTYFMHPYNIVLASSSPYRKKLLEKLPIKFTTASPDIDETAKKGERPEQLALRLALTKARAIQKSHQRHLIIASDQVPMLNQQQLTKPGNRQRNIEQLQACSGQSVDFFTSLCLLNSQSGEYFSAIDHTIVRFKCLSEQQIVGYVDLEQAYDCAGGFKVEGLGIVLFKSIESQDPNALIGLPIIKLIDLLKRFGVEVL